MIWFERKCMLYVAGRWSDLKESAWSQCLPHFVGQWECQRECQTFVNQSFVMNDAPVRWSYGYKILWVWKILNHYYDFVASNKFGWFN